MRDAQLNVIIAIGLVTLVVFVFLRSARSTFIPSVSVPVSIIATFRGDVFVGIHPGQPLADGADHCNRFRGRRAIVVTENITRHLEGDINPCRPLSRAPPKLVSPFYR